MKIIGTIEARMGSSRLPEKTLMKVYKDFSLLELVVKRFKLCKRIEDVVVCTTIKKQDDKIALWCEHNNVSYYRGSENDVLERVTNGAIKFGADAIVQMGADSAYLDSDLIDELITIYQNGNYDYVCNDLELTYPLGIYGHIVNVEKLRLLNQNTALTIKEREDVVRYIWEHSDQYKILNTIAPADKQYPHLRLTIDYSEDLALATKIYTHFNRLDFTTTDIINLYNQDPALFAGVSKLIQHSAPFIKKSDAE